MTPPLSFQLEAMMEFQDMVLRNNHPIDLESLQDIIENSFNFYKELIKQIFSSESLLLTIKLLCKLLCVKIVFNAKFDIFREKSTM